MAEQPSQPEHALITGFEMFGHYEAELGRTHLQINHLSGVSHVVYGGTLLPVLCYEYAADPLTAGGAEAVLDFYECNGGWIYSLGRMKDGHFGNIFDPQIRATIQPGAAEPKIMYPIIFPGIPCPQPDGEVRLLPDPRFYPDIGSPGAAA